MKITSRLFEAFLKCATKCHLRSLGETSSGNEYAEWVHTQDESYRREAARRLQEGVPETERVVAPPANENLKAAKWRLAVDCVAQASALPLRELGSGTGVLPVCSDSHGRDARATTGAPAAEPAAARSADALVREAQTGEATRGLAGPRSGEILESHLHAVERVPSEGRGKPAQFVPIRFIFRNKLTQDDRLLLAFDALVLSQMLGREVSLGKIIHGDDCSYARESAAISQDQVADANSGPEIAALSRAQPQITKVKTSALAAEVKKRLQKMTALLANPAPPDLVLNRHCAECEFQARCRKIAVEKDDLSLLARMNEKERQKLRSKGIFTVTQLSYTFRPRRRPKRQRDKREKYHHSLKALAIREKKIHIVGSPELKIEGTPVYLDVEGQPDRDFYYLIGVRIGNGESAVQHSLWADTVEDEGKIWREFLGILETVEKPVLIHYGSYETTFLRRMSAQFAITAAEPGGIVRAIENSLNLLSAIFAQVYFPTVSNGLKQIAEFLGFNWSELDAAGPRSVMWRQVWEASRDPTIRTKLVTYNAEDCEALALVEKTISRLAVCLTTAEKANGYTAEVVRTDDLKPPFAGKWRVFSSPVSELEFVSKAAHWDYQRDRIYMRSSKRPQRVQRNNKWVFSEASG